MLVCLAMQSSIAFNRKPDLSQHSQHSKVPPKETRILFLDQSGELGGAELCLTDIAQYFSKNSLVGVFAEGNFPDHLRQLNIPVKVLSERTLQVKKESGLWRGLKSLYQLIPLILKVARLSRDYDLIYVNTQKALVVGAIASLISRRPFIYHLHDIISPEHFSTTNRRVITTLANQSALIIANSQASREAFIQAGGQANRLHVVYNGFRLEPYADCVNTREHCREALAAQEFCSIEFSPKEGLLEQQKSPFIVGHFSRLSPWKGQHVLIEALQHCPDNVTALLVGDALFGEQDYVQQLHQQIKALNLEHRVRFLGFRSDIPQLMSACDLVAHTSTVAEPFGRVIVEAMLCGTPVVATAAGGAVELVEHGETGWLTTPSDAKKLASVIQTCQSQPEVSETIAQSAQAKAVERFNLETINETIAALLLDI